jgi:hypothetical protein
MYLSVLVKDWGHELHVFICFSKRLRTW